MAHVISERIVVTLSRIAKDSVTELDPVLDEDSLATLTEAVEGLVADESIVVEVAQEEEVDE